LFAKIYFQTIFLKQGYTKKMKKQINTILKTAMLSSTILASSLYADIGSAEINVNNNTLQVSAEYDLSNKFELNPNSNYLMNVSFLKSNQNDLPKNTQTLTSLGGKILNKNIEGTKLNLGLGIKAVMVDNSEDDFIAMPLSVFASYSFSDKITLDAEVNYAPSVISFLDAETYSENIAKLNYKIIDNGMIYIGARDIETKYDNGNRIPFDHTMFFGYKVSF
jgi:hypothetical protein